MMILASRSKKLSGVKVKSESWGKQYLGKALLALVDHTVGWSLGNVCTDCADTDPIIFYWGLHTIPRYIMSSKAELTLGMQDMTVADFDMRISPAYYDANIVGVFCENSLDFQVWTLSN